MRSFVLLAALVVMPALALADGGSDAGSAGSASPAAGSAMPTPMPMPADAAALRKTCVDAMNANPTFATDIVRTADTEAANRRLDADTKQHEEASRHIATNERHVILAYAAMWIVAAGFVIFLNRRQQALRGEIAQLKRDLDAATKESST